MNFDVSGINWLAVAVCSVAGFFLGGIWWMALFGKPWVDGYGFTEAELEAAKKTTGRNFAVYLAVGFVMAGAMAILLKNLQTATMTDGMIVGAFVGFVMIGGVTLMQVMSGNYKLKVFFIDAGYYGIWYSMMGAILASWK
jgi:hypothetical protein